MSWLQTIESALVERLRAEVPQTQVEAMPDKSFNFVHPKGTLLVMFAGFSPGQTLDTFASAQAATLSFEVLAMSRSLRDNVGLYGLVTKTIEALLGFSPATAKPLRLQRAGAVRQEDGVWMLPLTFSTETMLVPCLDNDPEADAPPMTNISFANCGHECEDC